MQQRHLLKLPAQMQKETSVQDTPINGLGFPLEKRGRSRLIRAPEILRSNLSTGAP
jgi:hypothetical protein